MRVFAIDIGSSAVKAGYWDGARFRSRARVGFRTEFEGVCAQAPAARILSAVERAGREVLRNGQRVDVVSFCAFSSGIVVTDDQGDIRIGAITHQDRRSVAEAQHLVRRLGANWLLHHTGNLPYPGGIGSSTLAWLHRHAPATLRGKVRIGQLSSLVGYMLTGQWRIDPSQAAFLGLWDIRTRQWNKQLCRAVGIHIDSLPHLAWADSVIGTITPRMANIWGRRGAVPEGTLVVGGFVDTSAASIQTPMRDGQLVHNAGSTDVLAMCLKTPQPAEGILTRPLGVGRGSFEERWLAVRTIAAAGTAIAWMRRTFFHDLSEPAFKNLLRKIAKTTRTPDAPACIPDFSGVRASIAQAIGGSFSGITLATSREDLLASLLRALVDQSTHNYQLLAKMRRPEATVYCMGGEIALANAMHAAWPAKHAYKQLESDGLTGLVKLATHTLGD